MTIKIQQQRIQRFNAWKKVLSAQKVRAPHPFHDPDDYGKSRSDTSTTHRRYSGFSELVTEFAAWDEASDEDFAKFEESLE